MKKIATIAALALGLATLAEIEGDYNTWLGYLSGESSSGNRATVQGAGAGGGATDLVRTDLIGAAAGVYAQNITDTVGIGYRALRYTQNVSNCVAIGSHALAGMSMNSGTYDATWINGHFVANPPVYDSANDGWGQARGTFYITADAAQTNALAPIFWDGENLHLRGYAGGVTNAITFRDMIGLTSCGVEQSPWFRNEVTFCPQKATVAYYSSDDYSYGENLSDTDKVPMVYLRKNRTSGEIEVWEGDTCLGTLSVTQ